MLFMMLLYSIHCSYLKNSERGTGNGEGRTGNGKRESKLILSVISIIVIQSAVALYSNKFLSLCAKFVRIRDLQEYMIYMDFYIDIQ